jgi:osomolarity two-component system, phosphorelay intermediate protein YPD1
MIPSAERAMKELGITMDIYKELVDCFLEQVTDSLKGLDEAMVKKDMEEVARIGHFVKGAASNIRLEDVRQIAYGIERVKEDESGKTELPNHVSKLKDAIKLIRQQANGS